MFLAWKTTKTRKPFCECDVRCNPFKTKAAIVSPSKKSIAENLRKIPISTTVRHVQQQPFNLKGHVDPSESYVEIVRTESLVAALQPTSATAAIIVTVENIKNANHVVKRGERPELVSPVSAFVVTSMVNDDDDDGAVL